MNIMNTTSNNNNTSFKNKSNTLSPLAAREYDQLNILEEDGHASLCNTMRFPKSNRINWTLENTEKFYKVDEKKISYHLLLFIIHNLLTFDNFNSWSDLKVQIML